MHCSLQAATGETIGAEELGGADVHCRISGCTDHYASSEEEAMAIARRLVTTLNSRERGRRVIWQQRDCTPGMAHANQTDRQMCKSDVDQWS